MTLAKGRRRLGPSSPQLCSRSMDQARVSGAERSRGGAGAGVAAGELGAGSEVRG